MSDVNVVFRNQPRRGLLASLGALLLSCSVAQGAADSATTPQLSVRLVVEQRAIAAGTTFTTGLSFALKQGWHIYWINPGGAGLPTQVSWQLPDGLTAGDIQWPTPQKVPEPGVTLYGYTGAVLLPIPMQAPSSLRSGQRLPLVADVNWTVCREVCIPGKARLELSLPVAASVQIDKEQHRIFDAARSAMPRPAPADWKVSATTDGDSYVLDVATGRPEVGGEFYSILPNIVDESSPQVFKAQPMGLSLRLAQSDFLNGAPQRLYGLLLASSGPAYVIDVPLATSNAASANAVTTRGGPSSASAAGSPGLSTLARTSLGAALCLAFLGGLILNLMPCVLPVLSLKVLGLAGMKHTETRQARVHGLYYTVGVLVSFWLLAGILLLLRAGGREVGWGFQMQSPGFVVMLTALMFLLALNMLGVFEIGTSWMGAGSSLADRGGHLGSFFTGVLATAVATPCTAPFMGVAIGFALTQSVAAIMLIFSALGLGLAAPYVLLAFNPQWARILPKPGLWMLKFKQAMSFPLFGAAIWLVWVYGEEQDINGVALLLAGLLLLAVAVWLHAAFKQSVARTTVTVCLILSGIALPLVLRTTRTQDATAPASVAKAAKPADTLLWEKFSPAKLEQYRAAAKPVLVDFSAAWCVTCQINERLVLRSAEIQRRLKEQDIALLKADWTAYDPEITAALAEHGRVGVPFYLMYGDARQPIIETEILTSSTLLAALDRVRSTP